MVHPLVPIEANKRIAALKEERDRLREALNKVSALCKMSAFYARAEGKPGLAQGFKNIDEEAQAALEET
jgi:hypothetical protein